MNVNDAVERLVNGKPGDETPAPAAPAPVAAAPDPEPVEEESAGEPETEQAAPEGDTIEVALSDMAAVLGVDEDMLVPTEEGPAKIRAKVRGEEIEATLPDMVKSYQLQQVHDQKAADLNQRLTEFGAVAEKTHQDVQTRVAELDGTFAQLQAALQQSMAGPEMQALRQTDPTQYLISQQQAQQQIEQLNGLRQQVAEQWQKQQQDYDRARQQAFAPHTQRLFDMLDKDPSMPDVRQEAGQKRIIGYMADLGFADHETAKIAADPRLVAALTKAARLDDMLANAKPEAAKLKTRMKVAKPGVKPVDQNDKALKKARAFKAVRKAGGNRKRQVDAAVAALLGG